MQQGFVKARKIDPRYAEIRAKLIQRGYTLASFAKTFGYPRQTVYSAVKGRRHGVLSVKIRNHIEELTNE